MTMVWDGIQKFRLACESGSNLTESLNKNNYHFYSQSFFSLILFNTYNRQRDKGEIF